MALFEFVCEICEQIMQVEMSKQESQKAVYDFELYLERFFFDNKKFVAETKKMAQRHVNHIVGKQII